MSYMEEHFTPGHTPPLARLAVVILNTFSFHCAAMA
jgi:hypothetical protein